MSEQKRMSLEEGLAVICRQMKLMSIQRRESARESLKKHKASENINLLFQAQKQVILAQFFDTVSRNLSSQQVFDWDENQN